MKLITARFKKTFLVEPLRGISILESMDFVSVKAAETWFKNISAVKSTTYKIEDFYIENPSHAPLI